jgi:hypothetical protein
MTEEEMGNHRRKVDGLFVSDFPAIYGAAMMLNAVLTKWRGLARRSSCGHHFYCTRLKFRLEHRYFERLQPLPRRSTPVVASSVAFPFWGGWPQLSDAGTSV